MRYLALATDGDGTLMRAGHMARQTVAALMRWRASGRKLLLVTGERPQELCDFPHLQLFDRAVAENGALLVCCDTRKETKLAPAPPQRLLSALRQAGVTPLKVGRATIETTFAHDAVIRQLLDRLQVAWAVARNRQNLMIVPQGVTKATGLQAVLQDLGISPRRVVGVGDAENDIPLIGACGLSVAVGNAVPPLKRRAQLITAGRFGKGIVELVDRLLA
jgi:hydroxymethylpyrimidine pyrophosphatase-like HAD family hydrolase